MANMPNVKIENAGRFLWVICPYCKKDHQHKGPIDPIFNGKDSVPQDIRMADCGKGEYRIYFDKDAK